MEWLASPDNQTLRRRPEVIGVYLMAHAGGLVTVNARVRRPAREDLRQDYLSNEAVGRGQNALWVPSLSSSC